MALPRWKVDLKRTIEERMTVLVRAKDEDAARDLAMESHFVRDGGGWVEFASHVQVRGVEPVKT